MALSHTPKMLPEVIKLLVENRGNWRAICEATGINYNTLQAIAQSKSKNPSVNTIECLHEYLTQLSTA